MNPRDELKALIRRLEDDLHNIANTSANRLRITDRTRELVRCVDLLHRLEGRTGSTSKVRYIPSPDDDPDDVEVLDRLYQRVCGRED